MFRTQTKCMTKNDHVRIRIIIVWNLKSVQPTPEWPSISRILELAPVTSIWAHSKIFLLLKCINTANSFLKHRQDFFCRNLSLMHKIYIHSWMKFLIFDFVGHSNLLTYLWQFPIDQGKRKCYVVWWMTKWVLYFLQMVAKPQWHQ